MHGMLNMDGANKFHFNWKDLVPSGLSVKDAMAPTALAFKNSRTFQMGGIFGAVSFLNITASDLSDQLLKEDVYKRQVQKLGGAVMPPALGHFVPAGRGP